MSTKCSLDLSETKDDDNVSTLSPLSANEEGICEQLCNDLMTSSYTEISFDESDENIDPIEDIDAIELGEELVISSQSNNSKESTKKLSSSLSLPQLSTTIVNWTEKTKASYETENLNLTTNTSLGEKYDFNEVPDFVEYNGPFVSYVAKDFEQKLKHSSSSPSTEGHSSRQSERVELKILNDLEKQTKLLSKNINSMLRHISESTHNITSLTVECISTYEMCLNKTCDVIDSNIKSMYQLMAKCEELNQSMKPINKMSEELKEVKRLLELFEKAVEYRM